MTLYVGSLRRCRRAPGALPRARRARHVDDDPTHRVTSLVRASSQGRAEARARVSRRCARRRRGKRKKRARAGAGAEGRLGAAACHRRRATAKLTPARACGARRRCEQPARLASVPSLFDHPLITERYFFPRPDRPARITPIEVEGATLACAIHAPHPGEAPWLV